MAPTIKRASKKQGGNLAAPAAAGLLLLAEEITRRYLASKKVRGGNDAALDQLEPIPGGAKRGPHRSRKVHGGNDTIQEGIAPEVGAPIDGGAKRGRGRPRKVRGGDDVSIAPEVEVDAPVDGGAKRGRGRPLKVRGGEYGTWEPIINAPVVVAPLPVTGGAKRGRGRPRKVHGGNAFQQLESFSASLGDKIAGGVKDMFAAQQNILAGAGLPPAAPNAVAPSATAAAQDAPATTEAFQGSCGHFGGAKKKRTVVKRSAPKKRVQYGGDMCAIVGGVF